MPQLLKLTQLINKDGMPQMEIGRSWIEPCLNTQWLTALKFLDQFRLDQHLFGTTLN